MTNHANPLIIENEILIDAPAAKVWDALVNPDQTKKYMFGCETISEWKEGSALLWRGNHEGKDVIFVKGEVVKIVPGKHLTYTTFDPHSTLQDVPANYLWVTYDLEEQNGKTCFTVRQGDFSKVAEGDRRYQEAYNNGEGWSPILKEIKKLVE